MSIKNIYSNLPIQLCTIFKCWCIIWKLFLTYLLYYILKIEKGEKLRTSYTWVKVISEELFGDRISGVSRSPGVGLDGVRTVSAFRELPRTQDLVPGDFGTDGSGRYTPKKNY